MGTTFRYISDKFVDRAPVETCVLCKTKGQVFPIEVAWDQEEWELACECTESICLTCIRMLPLRRFAVRIGESQIQQMVNSHYPKGSIPKDERIGKYGSVCDEFRRTPLLPLFVQDEDWPFCCGEFCEYLYSPQSYEEAEKIGSEIECWHGDLFDEMVLQPETLNEVNVFGCLSCPRKLYTWQGT